VYRRRLQISKTWRQMGYIQKERLLAARFDQFHAVSSQQIGRIALGHFNLVVVPPLRSAGIRQLREAEVVLLEYTQME
jgi:hypothetical protein